MNKAGYDYAILGNHEFDYGLKQISELMDATSFKYLAATFYIPTAARTNLKNLFPMTS